MTEKLGLRGAELQVFALIYSFSHDGLGTFSGSREYIASTTGFSVKTVSRALASLTDKNYVKRKSSQNSPSYIYTANLRLTCLAIESEERDLDEKLTVLSSGAKRGKSDSRQSAVTKSSEMRTESPEMRTKSPEDEDKMSRNNKDDNKVYNKEIINTSPSADRACTHARKLKNGLETERSWFDTDIEPIDFVSGLWEKYKLDIYITKEQFEHLESLLYDENLVVDYLWRLQDFINSNRHVKIHSAYRTVLKWIREDFSAENPPG